VIKADIVCVLASVLGMASGASSGAGSGGGAKILKAWSQHCLT